MAWTSDDLLADVRRSGMLPTSAADATADADLLAHADKEVSTCLMPAVLGVCEEWGLQTTTLTVSAGTSRVRLPTQAWAGRIRDVKLTQGNAFNLLPRIEPSREWEWTSYGTQGFPVAYYVESNNLVLVPTPNGATTLQLRYYARPGRLALTSACRALTAVTASGSNYRLAWSTGSTLTATYLDVVRADAPFDYAPSGLHLASQASASTYHEVLQTAFPSATSLGLASNSYLCVSDTTCVVPLPETFFYVLSQRTVARVLQALGYKEEAAFAFSESKDMLQRAVDSITPRTDAQPRRLTSWMSGPAGRRRGAWWGN